MDRNSWRNRAFQRAQRFNAAFRPRPAAPLVPGENVHDLRHALNLAEEQKRNVLAENAFRRAQRVTAAVQPKRPAAPVDPSEDVHDLQQVLNAAEEQNKILLAENTSLKLQIERFNCTKVHWDSQKGELIQEIKALQRTLDSRNLESDEEVSKLQRALQSSESKQQEADDELRKCEAQVSSLCQSLHAQIEATERVQASWQEEGQKIRTAYENSWKVLKEDFEKATELEEKCEELELVVKKKDKMITRLKTEMMALTKEHLQTSIQLSYHKELLNQSDGESRRSNTLEDLSNQEHVDHPASGGCSTKKRQKQEFLSPGKRTKTADLDNRCSDLLHR